MSNFGQGEILFLDTPMENGFIITSKIVLIYGVFRVRVKISKVINLNAFVL